MTELDIAIEKAFQNPGDIQCANQVYQVLLRDTLYIPIDATHVATENEPFQPLIAAHKSHYFLLAFDTEPRFTAWAESEGDAISYQALSGRALIDGMGVSVTLCLNPGLPSYKEFNPGEIKRLKTVIAKTKPRATQ